MHASVGYCNSNYMYMYMYMPGSNYVPSKNINILAVNAAAKFFNLAKGCITSILLGNDVTGAPLSTAYESDQRPANRTGYVRYNTYTSVLVQCATMNIVGLNVKQLR